jgi:hypothetical protein
VEYYVVKIVVCLVIATFNKFKRMPTEIPVQSNRLVFKRKVTKKCVKMLVYSGVMIPVVDLLRRNISASL